MARPQKNTVDYFPFYCEDGKKMYYLEETYGNDGFATFIKILRELAKVDYHFIDLSKKSSMMFLSAKCKVSIETLESIISDLVMLEKFDSVLWNDNKIIWCQSFIDSIQDAYLKRSNDCITYNRLLQHLDSLGIRKLKKSKKKPFKSVSEGDENTQTILEDNILEETRENIEGSFEKFWDLYDKKVDRKKSFDKWKGLKESEREEIIKTTPTYVKANPESKYRKNPVTFFNNRSWEDEIIKESSTTKSNGAPKFQKVYT